MKTSDRIRIRLDDKELSEITRAANRRGMTVSTYLEKAGLAFAREA